MFGSYYIPQFSIALLLVSCGTTINASPLPSVGSFLCFNQSSSEQQNFISYISSAAVTDDKGETKIPGPIKMGSICLNDITLVGSFGVIMTTGTVCSPKQSTFIKFLRNELKLEATSEIRDGLKFTSIDNAPFSGTAAFKIPNEKLPVGLLIVYQGDPSFEPIQNSKSGKVSFMCSRQGSGPQ